MTVARARQLFEQEKKPDAADIELDTLFEQYINVWDHLEVKSEFLKHTNDRTISTRVVVPSRLRDEVIRSLHLPAHYGYESTLRRISQRFWWPRVLADVSAFVKNCEVCDRNRCANPPPRAPFGHLPNDEPFATLYIDIVGGQGSLSLGASPKSILTMIDGLTGWAEAVPLLDQRAITVARAVYSDWIFQYGVPESINSDRGS